MTQNIRRPSGGFTLIEVVIAISIIGVLAAIAVPAVLTMRNTAPAAAQQADLRAVGSELDLLVQRWKGVVPAASVSITGSAGTWTTASNYASGKLSANSSLAGTLWSDTSYCLVSTNTQTSRTFQLRSDVGQPTETTAACPALGFADSSGAVSGASSSNLAAPANLTAISTVANTVSASWTAVSGATGYVISITGGSSTSVTTNSATLSGVTSGSQTVTVYAKDGTKTGPGSNATVNVVAAAGSSGIVFPTWTPITSLSASLVPYTATITSNPSGYGNPEYTKAAGIVQMRGWVVVPTGATGATTTFATLPSGYWPDHISYFALSGRTAAQGSTTVSVDTAGNVAFTIAPAAGAAYDLSGIIFPSAGTATWTPFSKAGSGAFYSTAGGIAVTTFKPRSGELAPSYWIDSNGLVWMAGVFDFSGTRSTTALTVDAMLTAWRSSGTVPVPNSYQAVRAPIKGSIGYAGIAVNSVGLYLTTGTTQNYDIALDGIVIQTAASRAAFSCSYATVSSTNYKVLQTASTYGTDSATAPAYCISSYGLAVLSGSGNSKNSSDVMFYLPPSIAPATSGYSNARALAGGSNATNRPLIFTNDESKAPFSVGIASTGDMWFDGVAFFP